MAFICYRRPTNRLRGLYAYCRQLPVAAAKEAITRPIQRRLRGGSVSSTGRHCTAAIPKEARRCGSRCCSGTAISTRRVDKPRNLRRVSRWSPDERPISVRARRILALRPCPAFPTSYLRASSFLGRGMSTGRLRPDHALKKRRITRLWKISAAQQ